MTQQNSKTSTLAETSDKTDFRFRAEDHTYWLGSRRLESVTEVLAGVGVCDLEWVTETALSRGRAVHAAAHLMDTLDLSFDAFLARYDLDEDLYGYLRAWEACKRETGMEILDSEQPRYHPTLKFAGTRDKRAIWQRQRYKLDLKTVGTVGAKGPKWAAEQTAAYDLLEPSEDQSRPDRRASILLYPDGSWRPELHHDYRDASYFLAYLTTFRRLKYHNQLKEQTHV